MNTRRHYRTVFLICSLIIASSMAVFGQETVWSPIEDVSRIQKKRSVQRDSFPRQFKLFGLNREGLEKRLFSVVDRAGEPTIVSLPNADGGTEQFELFEASNFDPKLQAKFPEIRSFSGRGVTDKHATVKLSISPQGVQGTVFRTGSQFLELEGQTEIIEPYSKDRTVYAVFKSARRTGELPWACKAPVELALFSQWKQQISSERLAAPESNTGEIRTMRLAQSSNGEYANYFGATDASQVAKVLAGFNATLTRANGVYERDLGLHLNLIPETTSLIFYDPATDPYSDDLGSWNDELAGAIAAQGITPAMYDIGHMFGASGGGGNAGCIGCVCSDNHDKGMGITSPADAIPEGDNFDIDYVVHEVGHQLGANHTFSYGQLPIPEMLGQDKEIGSGITIMGYAGITPVTDVAPHSIDVFHETSIEQIQINLPTRGCPVAGTVASTGNRAPVVAPVSNYTIPILTPFALTGSATDPDGDPLTYNWEQNDSAENTGITIAAAAANPAKVIGPNWLSFNSSSSPTKYFPSLSTILAGEFTTQALPGGDPAVLIEALSAVSRDLNFRLTVRDNHPYVPGVAIGQTQYTDMKVSVTNLAGPFKVAAPDSAVTWEGDTTQTITWLPANTMLPPVSALNVNIRLSVDGGKTFPIVLKANTPNDGSETVVIPRLGTSSARIMVEAAGNIFFDISDASFTIMINSYEADVAARPNGDGSILSDDVVQIRKFLNGTDTPDQTTDEFQRADSSPFADRGDGRIFSDDVVQARRYQNGTNAKQAAGGPMTASAGKTVVDQLFGGLSKTVFDNAINGLPRQLRIENATTSAGQTVTVNIRVDSAGDESEYGFILDYDSSVLSNPVIGAGSVGASVRSCNVSVAGQINCSVGGFADNNTNSADSGIGEIGAGTNQLLMTVTFTVAGSASPGDTPLTLSNVNASSDAPQLFTPSAANGTIMRFPVRQKYRVR